MVLNVHRKRTAYLGRGGGGEGAWRWGEREMIYLSLHCHHQNDSWIKMGSDERDKATSQCPQTTVSEEKGEPKRIRTEVPLLTIHQPNALPLGQTDSHQAVRGIMAVKRLIISLYAGVIAFPHQPICRGSLRTADGARVRGSRIRDAPKRRRRVNDC